MISMGVKIFGILEFLVIIKYFSKYIGIYKCSNSINIGMLMSSSILLIT